MKQISILTFFSLLLLLPFQGKAQQGVEGGIYLGATNYLGDLAEQLSLNETHPAVGVFVRWNPFKVLGIKTSVIGGELSGDDINSPFLFERAFSFSDPFWSLNLQLEFFPFAKRKYLSPIKFKPGVQPFAHGGIGYTFF